jgi:hypothetical protein
MTERLPSRDIEAFRILSTGKREFRYFGRVAFCLLFLLLAPKTSFGQGIEKLVFEFDPQAIDFENPDIIPYDMQRSDRPPIGSAEDYWKAYINFMGIRSTFDLIKSNSHSNYYLVDFEDLGSCLDLSTDLIAYYGEPYESYLPKKGDRRHYEIGWKTNFGRMVFDCREMYSFGERVFVSAYLKSGPTSEVKEVSRRITIECDAVVEAEGAPAGQGRKVTLAYVIDDDDKELLAADGVGSLLGNIARFDPESIVLFWVAKDNSSRFDVTIDRITGDYSYIAVYQGEKASELGSAKFVTKGSCRDVAAQ